MPPGIGKMMTKQKKILHPNSRKMMAIVKKTNRAEQRVQSKQNGILKQNLIREKMLYIQKHMIPEVCPYLPEMTAELLEKYIARHDEELKLIAEKNKSNLKKKNRSHASREDILRMTEERDHDEYNGCGIEIPNILNSTQCEMLRKWDGDVRYLSNFVFRRFGKRHVGKMRQKLLTNSRKKIAIQKSDPGKNKNRLKTTKLKNEEKSQEHRENCENVDKLEKNNTMDVD